MDNSDYADLINTAQAQSDIQKLLFVFTQSELPENSTSQQKKEFLAGKGGALSPVMYVDKFISEVKIFKMLVEQSSEMPADWSIVFVGALSGTGETPPAKDKIEAAFLKMIEDIKNGKFSKFLAFDKNGDIVRFL
jgi:hypothetical protein